MLASEAAVLIGCSRQYVHQNLDRLDAHMLSNYVVIPRKKAIEFRKQREAAERRRQALIEARERAEQVEQEPVPA